MKKGLHLILDLDQCTQNLIGGAKVAQEIHNKIEAKHLTILSSDTKVFDGEGFTSYFLLAESHISIHTWPEIKRVYADIFLCNYSCDNSHIAIAMKDFLIALFSAGEVRTQEIER